MCEEDSPIKARVDGQVTVKAQRRAVQYAFISFTALINYTFGPNHKLLHRGCVRKHSKSTPASFELL